VYRLKQEFPQLTIVLNGGVHTARDALAHLARVDGVMLGRAAYHDPWCLAEVDAQLWSTSLLSRAAVARRMTQYAQAQASDGTPLRAVARHMLGLFHGQPRARVWRQMLSDAAALAANDASLILRALDAVQPAPVAG
jgi:tRNA-dihydrouridine synthase A